MRLQATTSVRVLLRRYPEVEEVFGWYSISLTAAEKAMSLRELCKSYRLDFDDVLLDIEAMLEDADEDDDDDDDDDDDVLEDDYEQDLDEFDELDDLDDDDDDGDDDDDELDDDDDDD